MDWIDSSVGKSGQRGKIIRILFLFEVTLLVGGKNEWAKETPKA